MHTTFRPLAISSVALLAVLAVACEHTSSGPGGPVPPHGVVVLDGYAQPSYTLLGDTGSVSTNLVLGSNSEFDAGGFTLRNDTALAVSSRNAGDVLFVASLRDGAVRRVQLPALSNGAAARLLSTNSGTRIGVALRDSGAIALVSIAGASGVPNVKLLRAAGRCPTDLFESGDAIWSVDANATCGDSTYASLGIMRLIRFPTGSVNHDTINLAGLVGSAASAEVVGNDAYVASSGVADFSTYPAMFTSSGAIAKIDLATRQAVKTLSLPQGSYGGTMHAGADGRLYVVAYTSTSFDALGVFAIDPATLAFTGTRAAGKQYLLLRKTGGGEPACVAATADALGHVYCVENAHGAATLYVFDASGTQIRSAPAGVAAVDLGLR